MGDGMGGFEEMLELKPYSLEKGEKEKVLGERLIGLSRQHYGACEEYRRVVDAFGVDLGRVNSYYDLPFLPVRKRLPGTEPASA